MLFVNALPSSVSWTRHQHPYSQGTCYLTTLAPSIAPVVSLSLQTGVVLLELKRAVVTPPLKDSKLDPNVYKHYRPISNLHFLAKLAEIFVVKQLSEHLTCNNLYEGYQSAYMSNHSMEMALIWVSNDILEALRNKQSVKLVLLDMSAAFNTIDHIPCP